jgi:TonB family protein
VAAAALTPRRRRAAARRDAGPGLWPGIVVSVLLHLGFAALAVVASLQREKPPEPLPPPAYAVEFEAGAPERPAEQESLPSPEPTEPVPDAVAEEEPPPPPMPPIAMAEPPLPAPAEPPVEEAEPSPPEPEEVRTAETDPPQPDDLPGPPPVPPRPQREAALTAPPRPARPPPPERLPGLYLPDLRFAPLPSRPEPPRRGLDLSPGSRQQLGRDSPEAQLSVRGAKVGPDWRNAFRRWLDDHGRYPPNAALVGEQGTTRIELIVEPDGRVRSGRLLRRSGSVWLDAGTVSLFRNAVLPPFPPGADPDGVTVDLTINYVLIR